MASIRSFSYVLGSLEGILHRGSTYQGGANAEPCLQGDDSEAHRRRFLCQLSTALMTYGSSVPRAQYLTGTAAERLNVEISIAVLPAYVLIIFPPSEESPRDETHLLPFQVDLDLSKLQEADELANGVGLYETPLWVANSQLRTIVTRPSPYGMWWELLGYTLSATTASLLFFSGNEWDALFCLGLGLIVGLLSLTAQNVPLLGSVLEFVSAVVVSFAARVISVYFRKLDVCYFAMALSSLVWHLPGQKLTIGISEVVQSSILPGASRIVHSLLIALQMGFGLVLGEKMAWWCSEVPIKKQCSSTGISDWWGLIWFLGYAVATNVLLKARLWQWTGMILASGVGVLVDSFVSPSFGTETSALLSAFSIGIAGSFLGYFSKDVPLSITFAGIQMILPGGIGVEGAEEFMEKDVLSGIQFVISMISICLSITLGLLLSKIVIRDAGTGFFTVFPHTKDRHVLSCENLRKDNEEEENEQLAV